MKIVFREMMRFKGALFLAVLTVVGTTMCTLGLPALLSIMIDESIPNQNIPQTLKIGGLMIILVVVGLVCGVITSHSSAIVSMGVGRNLRSKIFEKVQYYSETEFDHFSSSSLITRTNNDITQVQTFLNQCLRIALQAPVMCIGGICLALWKSARLSSILVISMPVMVIAIWLIAGRAIPLSTAIQSKIDRINLVMREKLTGVRVIRAFGTIDFETEKFDRINLDYKRTNMKMQRTTNALMPVLMVILSLTAAGIMLIAQRGYRRGVEYEIGDVMAIIQYVMQIMIAVMMLSMIFVFYPRAATAARRACEVLEMEPVIQNKKETKDNTARKGSLAFRNVSFAYPGAEVPAIHNISFEAAAGETTAIIGGTGMGKSTIVNLIPRFYDVAEGEILVDGVDVRDYDLQALRRKIGFVPQKANLFSGTIESNILFGDEHADEDRVEETVKIAQSYDFVMKKEEGFQSPISQGGSNVSGGQRQRLAIARAIVRKPEIYVFDDSFSALDFKTDKALRSALGKETGEATVVIVAQRVSTIMEADRILVIDKGEAVGIGTHRELLASCEVYRQIVESQMSKEEINR